MIFLGGSFSAVSKPIFASKYSLESIFRDLQDPHTFAPRRSGKINEKLHNVLLFFHESVEAKNVVWTHYLLCIRHMAISKKMRKLSEKCKKIRVPFGSLPDTILETILGAFGVSLGSLGAPNWEKGAFQNGSKK